MNQKINKILSIILFALYVALIGVLMFFMWQLPASYGKVEKQIMEEAESAVLQALEQPVITMDTELSGVVQKYPMELVIKNGDNVVFQTVPETDFNVLRNSLNEAMVLTEQELEVETEANIEYDVWFTIYHITASQFINSFLYTQSILVLILVALIVMITIYMQFTLFAPMRKIKKALEDVENNNFSTLDVDAETDVINQKFSKFTRNVTTTMQNASRQHTELERNLQMERERLNNTIVVSRALIHDLKTPVHEVMLENEYRKDHAELTVKSYYELLNYNIEHSAQILDDINEVLEIVDFDMYMSYLKNDTFDLSKLMVEMRKTFTNNIREKSLGIDLIIDEEMVVNLDRISTKLLIHNMLSNATQYAVPDTDIVLEASIQENTLIINSENESTIDNIERMKRSKNIFNIDEEQTSEEHRFGSGNGLFLINELSEILGGRCEMHTEEDQVIVEVKIPLGER